MGNNPQNASNISSIAKVTSWHLSIVLVHVNKGEEYMYLRNNSNSESQTFLSLALPGHFVSYSIDKHVHFSSYTITLRLP